VITLVEPLGFAGPRQDPAADHLPGIEATWPQATSAAVAAVVGRLPQVVGQQLGVAAVGLGAAFRAAPLPAGEPLQRVYAGLFHAGVPELVEQPNPPTPVRSSMGETGGHLGISDACRQPATRQS
jgi:hypothetical protein